MSQVLVTGATGLVGRALVARLAARGSGVVALSRDPLKAWRSLSHKHVQFLDDLDQLPASTHLDAVVHLAGARVLDRSWSSTRKQLLLDSRLGIAARVRRLMMRLHRPPRVMLCASAVSYYGSSKEEPCPESRPSHGAGFGSQLCVRIEQDAAVARDLGVRVVPLRLGIVLAREDGALPPLAGAARFGMAATLGTGSQPVAWVHLHDAVRLIEFAAATPELDGPLNVVAPEVVSQADFAGAIASHCGRRARLKIPAAALRLLMGERSSLLLEGQRAVPAVAEARGFHFEYPNLSKALAHLLN